MNIAFLDYAQSLGGSNRASIQMAENLKQSGHEVILIDFYGCCKPYVDECVHSSVPFFIAHKGDPFYINAEKSVIRRIWNILRFGPHLLFMNKKINELIKNQKISYVCISTIRPLLCLALRKSPAKIVFFAHGWYLKKQISWLLRLLLKNKVNKIVAISEATRQSLYNNGIAPLENIYTIHNYIQKPEGLKSYEKRNDEFVINICGGFIPEKGHHIAIEIATELKKRGVNFKMYMTGIIYEFQASQLYYNKVEKMVTERHLENEVEIVVNKTNVLDYTNSCDVLIHPSSTEGFPLAILEAMALGKPVIANAVGGIPDMIIDNYNGFLSNFNDVNDYVNKIIRLAGNEDLYKKMSERTSIIATKCFSKKIQMEKLSELFVD